MEITLPTNLIWLTTILIISLDFVIFMGSKNKSSRMFVFLSFTTAIWVISQGFLISTEYPYFADWLIRSQYVMGIIIALGFYIFSIIYPYDKKPKTKILIISVLVIIIFTYLYLWTDLLNTGVTRIGGYGRWSWQFGPLHPLFDIVFSLIWLGALRKLYISYISAIGLSKINLRHMFWGLTLGIIPPSLANILLPTFGIYFLNWTGPISSTIWIYIIGYSIIRYRQMNVRVVITEVLAVAMTVIFFINIFIQAQFGVWENIITFLVFLLLATFLIRGVLTESRQREELRVLNETLEQKVAEQTKEVRKSYDLEKQARRELEKLNETKDQFIMITQHSLRTPLNNIQAGIKVLDLESKKDGDKNTNSPLERIKSGIDRLMRVTDDFLAITNIKSEANILNLSTSSLKPIIESILKDLDYEIKQKSIHIHYSNDNHWPNLNIDKSKMFDAILIVIENAVKYNNNGGNIYINTNTENDRFILQINDNGTGITREDKEKISHNLFHRGILAQKLNPIGMGVGLSIARTIIRAHHGEITIESEGENKGTSVTISIPIIF